MVNLKQIALLISSAASVFLTATPAFADWEFTRWGMTLEELRSASPNELGSGEQCPVNNSNNQFMVYQVEATSAWKIENTDFVVCYLFLNHGLHVIHLFSQNADLVAMVEELSQKYGAPTVDTVLQEIGIVSYVWDTSDEEIEFSIRSGLDYPYLLIYGSKSESDETVAPDGL